MKIVLTDTPEIENAGKYKKLKVFYKSDGKDSTKFIVSFGESKDVFETLKQGGPGDTYDIKLKKSDDGKYWNWVGITEMEGDELPPSRPYRKVGESNDERQVSIIKQTCLKAAAGFHMGLAGKESEKAVLDTAKVFYLWVTQPLDTSVTNVDIDLSDEVV